MLGVLITLMPGGWNELIDCQGHKVCFAVLRIMVMKTRWNSTLEMLVQAYRLREFTRKCLKNPKYSEYWPLFTTQEEWTILKYVMEVIRPFSYRILWMSKRCTVSPHHVISVYNNMFDHMDGVMWALGKKKTQWKEDLIFTVKIAQQKLSK
jgi:hypothetical protein